MEISIIEIKELCLFAVCIFNLGLGLLVLFKQPQRLVNRAFALVATGIFVWGSGIILISRTHIFGFNTMIMYGFVIILYGLVIFAKVFPSKTTISRTFCIWSGVPLLSIIILTPMKLIVRSGVFRPDSNPEPVNGPFYPILLILSAAYVGASLCLFIRTYRRSKGRERDQMGYFLFGLAIFVICAFVFDIMLPSIGIFKLNFMGAISSIVLTGTTAYAIIRHQLMDIRVAIQRSLIYFIFLITAMFVYVAGLQLLGILFQGLTNTSTIVSAGITMALGIFLWEPTRRSLEKVTDPIFFRGAYNYPDALQQLSDVLRTHVSRADIVTSSSEALMRIFKAKTASIRVADKESSMLPSPEARVSIPISFENRPAGLLELGEKRSGDSYTKRDMQLLSTFALQASVALEKGRLYQEVEEHNLRLEHLVEERTAEIKKLQEEQKQAMIDISHNLQTPLAIIRGQFEPLSESAPEIEGTDIVRKSLDRVSSFIRQLLRLAKLDSSAFEIELAPVNLAELVREQADYFDVMAEEQGGHIESSAPDELMIMGNKRLLEELMTNLVVNALAYRSPDRAPVIRMSLKQTNDIADIRIEDNGIGIAPEDLTDLFTRFYRSSRSKGTVPGSGLGLAICKRIAEKHGGSIRVESVLGTSTVFVLSLPIL